MTTHLGCWENTRKACKSLAFGYIEFTILKAFTSELKLRTNPVKAFNRMCAPHVNNFSNNLVERVDFSDSRVALLWAGL